MASSAEQVPAVSFVLSDSGSHFPVGMLHFLRQSLIEHGRAWALYREQERCYAPRSGWIDEIASAGYVSY